MCSIQHHIMLSLPHKRVLWNKFISYLRNKYRHTFLNDPRHKLCLPPSCEALLCATYIEKERCPPALQPMPQASCIPQCFPGGCHVLFSSSPSCATGEPYHLSSMLFSPLEDPPLHTPHRHDGSFLFSFLPCEQKRRWEKGTLKKEPIHLTPCCYS